jgi:uncharacterized protein YbjT (DUF2867 family)
VTVIVRNQARSLDWARRGAEVGIGSLDDRSFLSDVVRGTAGLFTLLPENVSPDDFHGARRRMADAIAGAVQESDVPHVVMLSISLAPRTRSDRSPKSSVRHLRRRWRS